MINQMDLDKLRIYVNSNVLATFRYLHYLKSLIQFMDLCQYVSSHIVQTNI